jgi:hypothetical protein
MSLMACIVALGWPQEATGWGAVDLEDVLLTLALLGIVYLLAAAGVRHRKEKAADLAQFRADCR